MLGPQKVWFSITFISFWYVFEEKTGLAQNQEKLIKVIANYTFDIPKIIKSNACFTKCV